MANVQVKLYGKLYIDSKIKSISVNANNISELFGEINRQTSANIDAKPIVYKDAFVYVNGKRCTNKRKRLKDADEIWLMSPTMGG